MATKNPIKKIFKKLLVRVLFGNQKIIIASTGRSGSHVLFNAIADGLIKHRFHLDPSSIIAKKLKRLCMAFVSRIAALPKEVPFVCKTHDVYEHLPKTNYKFIFVYGDPLDSAMSVEQEVKRDGLKWFPLHQHHLKATGKYDDLYEKDVLNYQGQLEGWMAQWNSDIICIDYDELWDKNKSLSKFVGFNVDLPPRRPRQNKSENSNINKEFFAGLRELKDRLKNEYESSITDRHHNRPPGV